jgi:glycerophosphoryl diester phosphodiesterase
MNLFREQNALRLGLPRPAPIGVYPETKHPSYFAGIGLPMETVLVETLRNWGYRDRQSPVFIQSFEVANLKFLNTITDLPLIQLMDAEGAPYDFVAANDPRKYTDMITPQGLHEIATYADGIGVSKSLVIPRQPDGSLGAATMLVRDAHASGLLVHAWTFRAENYFLPLELRSSTAPADLGDLPTEIRTFLATGLDGFFVDQPNVGVSSRDTSTLP